MTNCCSTSSDTKSRKYKCPKNGKDYNEVALRAILHHIKEPWSFENKNQTYYFCDDPDCEVVYFGQDNSTITKEQLRTSVGLKAKEKSALLCYCFGVTYSDYKRKPEIKNFIIQQTKNAICTCETHNPSGKCCLKDFPKQ